MIVVSDEEEKNDELETGGLQLVRIVNEKSFLLGEEPPKEVSPEGDKESSGDEEETPEPVGFLTGLGMALGITRAHSALTEV